VILIKEFDRIGWFRLLWEGIDGELTLSDGKWCFVALKNIYIRYIHPCVDRAGGVTCPPRMIPSRYTVSKLNRDAMEGGACAFLFRVSKLRLLYRGCIDSPLLCIYPSVVGYAAGSPFFTRQDFLDLKKRRVMHDSWHLYK